MKNKSFIQGLFYGLAFAESTSKHAYISCQLILWFNNGTSFSFAINRGISHHYGNFVAMLTEEQSCNLFDIVEKWLTSSQVMQVYNLGYTFENGEIRVTFKELINIIEALGTIDIDATYQGWLKIHIEKYQKK